MTLNERFSSEAFVVFHPSSGLLGLHYGGWVRVDVGEPRFARLRNFLGRAVTGEGGRNRSSSVASKAWKDGSRAIRGL